MIFRPFTYHLHISNYIIIILLTGLIYVHTNTKKHSELFTVFTPRSVSSMTKYGYEKWKHVSFHFANGAFGKNAFFGFFFGVCLIPAFALTIVPQFLQHWAKELHRAERGRIIMVLLNFTLSPHFSFGMKKKLEGKNGFKRLIDGYIWNTFGW